MANLSGVSRPVQSLRLWLVVLLAAVVTTACSGAGDAPSASAGFFPETFSSTGYVTDAHLLNTGVVSAETRTLRFHAVAPASGGWSLVVRCYRGRVKIEGAGTSGGRCQGTSGVIGGCAGGFDKHLMVTVDRRQPAKWGVAIYRSSCSPETSAERREKASPTASPSAPAG